MSRGCRESDRGVGGLIASRAGSVSGTGLEIKLYCGVCWMMCQIKVKLLTVISVFALLALAGTKSVRAAGAYVLGPQDKRFIRVVEWRPSVAETQVWDAFNREYTVRANGKISIPLVGVLKVEGLSVEELADKISRRLKEKLHLVSWLDTTVEVVSYRPFYLLGMVDKPGEYAYRPQMTVLQAVSLAGGVVRHAAAGGGSNVEKESVRIDGEVRALLRDIKLLEIKKYKLQSQLDEREQIRYPAGFQRALIRLGYKKFLERAAIAFKTRRMGWKVRTGGVMKKKQFVAKQLLTLKKQVALKEKELRLIKAERRKARSLVRRSLINSKEKFRIEQLYTTVQSGLAELSLQKIGAQNKLLELSQKIKEIRSNMKTRVAEELEQVEGEIRRKTESLNVARIMQSHLEISNPLISSQKKDRGVVFRVVRKNKDGLASKFTVSGAFNIRPGDVIEVAPRLKKEEPAQVKSVVTIQ